MDNFDWQRQLRYYWDLDLDNCVARMALSQYTYAYEYLGACPRLVITPLTVMCCRYFLACKRNDLLQMCKLFQWKETMGREVWEMKKSRENRKYSRAMTS